MKATLFHAAWLATLAVATPVKQSNDQGHFVPDVGPDRAVAIGGALDLPTTVSGSPQATDEVHVEAAQFMTIAIRNHYGGPLSTMHAHGAGPTPISSPPARGVMGDNTETTMVVPAGWNGNIAVNAAKFRVDTGDESLIEASFTNQGQGYAQGDINVSYVNGFSAAIVCWCDANNIIVGCQKPLHELNNCGNDNGQGSCRNPQRNNLGATSPTPFFAPCHGPSGAYTFPKDDAANALNQKCPNEKYTCCVGHNCRENPAQGGFH